MKQLSLSAVISAPAPGEESVEPPCFVYQQRDNEDTAPCNMAGGILSSLFNMMGFDVPSPRESKTYNTTISIKPKNVYTDLNISITKGTTSGPIYNNGIVEGKISVSPSDFIERDEGYYIDASAMLDLVESDNIISAVWKGIPYDDSLAAISPPPLLSVVSGNKIKSNGFAHGIILVSYDSFTIDYPIDILPREEVESGFYGSYLIVDVGECTGRPSFFKIKVPDCYEYRQQVLISLIKQHQQGEEGSLQLGRPGNPAGGERYSCDYCLCTLNLNSESHKGLCSTPDNNDSGRCISGPNHKDC